MSNLTENLPDDMADIFLGDITDGSVNDIIEQNNPIFPGNYIPRPRIDRLVDRAARGKLLYVIAGAGYGKTQAVQKYIERQPQAIVRLISLTESDNNPSRFWQRLGANVSVDNPDLAGRLAQFGFPDTLTRFKQFTEILKESEHRALRTFLVLDDFHVIDNRQITLFTERCVYLKIPNLCAVIISRTQPEINAVSLFAKGKAAIITEDELRFTEDEIAEFLKSQNIPFSAENISGFWQATKGWALGMQFLALALKRMPENIGHAVNTMKANVFKLFEVEAFNDFPEDVKKIIVKLSLQSDLPLAPLHGISDVALFLQNNTQLASFVYFDSLSGDYRVHPLYFEFLQSKRDILSDEEMLQASAEAADWCYENNYTLDAMRYFAKSRKYDRMLEIFFKSPFKLPHDTCNYYKKILESLKPVDCENENSSALILLKNYFLPLMLMGIRNFEKAEKLTRDAISKWENSDDALAPIVLYFCYANLAYVDMHTCTVTHRYDAPKYIKKSMEYLRKSSLPQAQTSGAFSVADIRSYACLVGVGAELFEFEKFVEAARQTVSYIADTNHNMHHGYDSLAACEIAFYRNDLDTAKKYAHQAIITAREKQQYSIEAMAKQYLLRISIHLGDYKLTKEILKQLRQSLDNPDFWNRQLLLDLTMGSFYATIGCPDMSPSWLIMDEKEANTEVHMPIAELVVSLNNYIALKKYDQALLVLYNSYPRNPYERFIFSEIRFSLIAAAAKVKTNDVSGALEDFKSAYSLSFNGEFEMFFIEMSKHLHPIIAAALRQKDYPVPELWLKKIDRKASVYAKKSAVIQEAVRKEHNIDNRIKLSERELEVLNDLYQGLFREEIAENRYLSINTVKKILQSIYIKLDANNNVDAIRIALEKKLIE